MNPLLSQTLARLAASFAAAGWAPTGRPDSVLALRQQPAQGVDHLLFVSEPWLTVAASPGQVLLACTVNVHYPELEACINDALDRDATEAGRQSLRLPLARLAPPDHLVAGQAHACSPEAGGTALLLDDFHQHLEPLRRHLCDLQVLGRDVLPPSGVDPWTWHLRRAAYLHLHADAAQSRRFLVWLQAQADQWLAEQAGAAPGGRHQAAGRAAEEALALAEALGRPRRRVFRLAPVA